MMDHLCGIYEREISSPFQPGEALKKPGSAKRRGGTIRWDGGQAVKHRDGGQAVKHRDVEEMFIEVLIDMSKVMRHERFTGITRPLHQ
jgi:hypothetical protein